MSLVLVKYDIGEYTNQQIKHVLDKINKGRRVHMKTLVKFNCEHLAELDEVKHCIIFPKKNTKKSALQQIAEDYAEPEPEPQPEPEPDFTKEDILNYIQTNYTNEKTKTTYKNAVIKSGDFNSISLQNDEFWDDFIISTTHLKSVLSPISTYISTYKPLKLNDLKVKITNQIKSLIGQETERAQQKTNLPLVISADEMLDKWQNIVNSNIDFSNISYQGMTDILWLGLYTTLPVRDDFGKVSLTNQLEDGFNYLNLETNEITVLGKKGSKTDRVFNLSKPLMELIVISFEIFPRDYLFTKTDGSALGLGNKSFTRAMKRIFMKKVTINDVRKSFTTKALNSSIQDFIEMAKKQGHSVNTALLYYTRENS